MPGDFVECGVNAGPISSAIFHRLRWDALGPRYQVAKDAFAAGPSVTDLDRIANFAGWPDAIVVQGVVPPARP